MQSTRVRRRKNSSFKQAIILLALLVVIVIMATGLHRSGLPSNLASLLNADYENFRHLVQFDSAKTAEVQREIAGFWTYSEGDPTRSPVSKREYMELIDNGILWQVNEWFINTPSGDHKTVTHVMYGFVKPYSYNPDNSAYYSETRIIRQFFIADGDTCYGQSQVDEIWQITRNDNGTINVNRRDYEKYTGELKDFFPDSDLLDLTNKITMARCQAAASMQFMAKRALTRTIEPIAFFGRAKMVDLLVSEYYKPIVLDELARRYDSRTVPDVMDMRITLAPNGTVSDLRYRSGKLVTRRFDELATLDVRSWLFPPLGDSQEDQGVEIKLGLK